MKNRCLGNFFLLYIPTQYFFFLCTVISHIYLLYEANLHHSATHHPQLSVVPHENKEMYPVSDAFFVNERRNMFPTFQLDKLCINHRVNPYLFIFSLLATRMIMFIYTNYIMKSRKKKVNRKDGCNYFSAPFNCLQKEYLPLMLL